MRDRGQIFLLFLLLCLGANIISSNAPLMAAIGVHSQVARGILDNYSMILACIFSLFFTYYFLELDIIKPGFKIPLFALSTLLSVLLAYSIKDHNLIHFVLPTLSVLTASAILAAGVYSLKHGCPGSLTHIIAFMFFLAGTLAEPFYDLGLIANAESSHNLTYASFAMAGLMFAIVIASQFAARQEEKERALAISNERFALATRGANEGLFDWNLATGEVFFSDQFRKIIGFRLENNIKGLRQWLQSVTPSDRKAVMEGLRRLRRNPKTGTLGVEYRVLGPQGIRWLYTKAVVTRSPAQTVIRVVGSTGDITARKQSEVALRASEARFRSITEAHPVPVLIVSLATGTILYASPGSEQLLGLDPKYIMQEFIVRFLPDAKTLQEVLDAVASNQPVTMKEVKLMCGDRSVIDAALSARRVTYQNEEAMVIGLYDLTERKEAETKIARQQEALQQSEKMAALGGLLAGVAHELNNPLSVVVGQATLLMEGPQEPKVTGRAEKIFKAADRCARIVKSFLALARRKPPERKPVDLNQIVKSSLELLGYQIRNGNIDVQLQLDPELPAITGDGDQLTQVVTNLVLNAAQAMETWKGAHRITITSGLDKAKGAEGQIFVSVADSGPGIPPEIRKRVFEPFFTTKGGTGGTGVGLSLCINIVASHNGQLTIGDTPGGGATFTMSLPPGLSASAEGGEGAQQKAELDIMRLLIVDDEVEIAQTLADLMEPEGHKIDIAANGAIALEKLHKGQYDAIISDLRMPVLDGPGLYDALERELPSYLNRIIYVTGDTLSTHVQEFLSQHPVPLIEKPYRLKDVRARLAIVIKDANAAAAAQRAG